MNTNVAKSKVIPPADETRVDLRKWLLQARKDAIRVKLTLANGGVLKGKVAWYSDTLEIVCLAVNGVERETAICWVARAEAAA
jgi:sRNA-binding regulator protein Hfq